MVNPNSTPTPAQDGGSSWWAPRLGRIAGIPIKIHVTFLLLLVWVAWVEQRAGGNPLTDIIFVVGIFGCVLLHELGHALMARRFGIPTIDITLYPFGGVARLTRFGGPSEEFWIALAGPLVNVVIAGLLWAGMTLSGYPIMPAGALDSDGTLIQRLLVANIFLALFNLLPAFPMDGGRILRAILSQRLGATRGTAIAATIGQGFAILFGLIGLLTGNFILLFVAFFLFVAAAGENVVVRSRTAFAGQHIRDAMITRFETLAPGQTLGDAADALLRTYQHDFPVVLGDQVLGVIVRDHLLNGLATGGQDRFIAETMDRQYRRAAPSDPIEAVLAAEALESSPILVFDEGRLVGIVTAENVREFIAIRQIRSARHGGSVDRSAEPPIVK